MSMGACLTDLVNRKAISEERATAMRAVYDELVQQYEPKFGRAAAESMATQKAMRAIDDDFLHRKRSKLLQAQAQLSIEAEARHTFDAGRGADGLLDGRGMLAKLVRDEKAGGMANVEYRWRDVKQSALAIMYDVLAKHRANLLGEVRNKAELDDVVRALWKPGEADVNARELADAWTRTAEYLRGSFNAAGGRIGQLEGWALPHSHDSLKVGAIGRDQWVDTVIPRLDRAKMLDMATGAPLSDGKLYLVLGEVYESIVSEGWNKRVPGGVGGKSVGNRHAEHRVLHFRSADDWLAYNADFGGGTPFEAMMHHVEIMSRDIAAMQVLGPNPAQTIQWMGDMIERDAALKGTMKDREAASKWRSRIDGVWNEIQGQNRRVESRNLALFGSTLRNWQAATKLGSAAIASISDHATRQITRHYNGLPAANAMGQYLKQLNPLDPRDREFARRAGIIGDEFTGRMAAQGRMHMEDAFGGRLAAGRGALGERLETANEVSRRLADGVMRTSGLNAHTVAGREAMGMEFMAALAHYAPDAWDKLPSPWRGFLDRHGIGADGWERLRATPMTDYKGAQWIKADDIADKGIRDKFVQGMNIEIDFAVPTGGLYIRSRVNAQAPGTWGGEFIRTAFQFKMFPITVMAMHGARMMQQANLAKRAGYAAAFLGATTVAGGMAYQLSELAKGKDPRDMTGGDFWWRAALKGGGLGVFGDAIEFSRNQYGQDVGDIVKGPSLGTAQTLADLGRAGIANATVDMDDPDAVEKAVKLRGRAVRNLLTREVPGGSLWYLRTAYERLLVDQVAAWAGEDPVEHAKKLEQRAAKEGGGFYAPPGAGGLRAPDFANAIGAGEPRPQ